MDLMAVRRFPFYRLYFKSELADPKEWIIEYSLRGCCDANSVAGNVIMAL